MPDFISPVTIATPVFILCIILEMIYTRRSGRGEYEATDSLTSLLMGLGNTVIPGLIGGFAAGWSIYVYDNWRITELGFSLPVIILALIADDLAYYWVHRLGHRIRWLWASHVVHHSSQHYNLTTALRQTWTSPVSMGFIVATPLYVLGFHPGIIAFVSGLNLVYQFWIHTEAIDKCPAWFEAVMNTPSHHRVHHSTLPEHLDTNYAGIFIIWDKFFGTFIAEDTERRPCRYGLVQDLGTFNPLRVATHEWVGIARDLASSRNPLHWFKYAFAPPGWTPDGSRKTSKMIKSEWHQEQEERKAEIRLAE